MSYLYKLRDECTKLCDKIWKKPQPKWKNRMKAEAWIEGHIGRSMMKAGIEEMLFLERLLLEKLKFGRCSIHLDKETAAQRRRIRIGGAWESKRQQIIRERGMKCEECGRELKANEVTIDHIEPVFKGGLTVNGNLRILCENPCHRRKSRKENREARQINLALGKELVNANTK